MPSDLCIGSHLGQNLLQDLLRPIQADVTLSYQPGSRIPQKGVTIILVKDGKFTLAQEIVPEKVPAP